MNLSCIVAKIHFSLRKMNGWVFEILDRMPGYIFGGVWYEWYLEAVSKPPLGPNLGVGRSVQILEIHQYSFGLNLAAALTLNPIEGFETASKQKNTIERV